MEGSRNSQPHNFVCAQSCGTTRAIAFAARAHPIRADAARLGMAPADKYVVPDKNERKSKGERGAFGASGSLFGNGRRRSSQVLNRAQLFQLEKCLDKKALDKIIYQMQSSIETRQKTKITTLQKDGAGSIGYDVDGFATFLSQVKALGALLFWKDAEEFGSIFGKKERCIMAEKIWGRYLEPGAEFEVTSLSSHSKDIKAQLKEPPEDLFEALQAEAHSMMLFELFPRFWDAVKSQEDAAGGRKSTITQDSTLKGVLKANDLEVHLFAEYCREHHCEDQVMAEP